MRRTFRFLAPATLLCAAALPAALPGAPEAAASSHSEAPGTAADRATDGTDVYAFTSPDARLNVEQRYTLTRVDGPRRTGTRTVLGTGLLVAPNNVGPKSIPGTTYDTALVPAAIRSLPGGIKSFCGPRDDPFFVFLGRA